MGPEYHFMHASSNLAASTRHPPWDQVKSRPSRETLSMPGTSLESMSLSLGPRIRSALADASSSLGADSSIWCS